MNAHRLALAGQTLSALAEGALWWASERLLAVGDLHLGRAERGALQGGAILPPYDTIETLNRVEALVTRHHPAVLVLLGDSFDRARSVDRLDDDSIDRLMALAAGRRLIWIAGNHDPLPPDLPGTHMGELVVGRITFRHIAQPHAVGEVSAHYHPKTRFWLKGTRIARPCFLADRSRIILPAFGVYTGGLDATAPALDKLMGPDAVQVLTGKKPTVLPYRLPA